MILVCFEAEGKKMKTLLMLLKRFVSISSDVGVVVLETLL